MLKNWFKIFLYNTVKNKLFAFLTVLGLAIGITGIIFSTLYWKDENSFDQWNSNNKRVYEVLSKISNGETWGLAQAPLIRAISLKTDVVQDYCYYLPYYVNPVLSVNGKKRYIQNAIITQNNFFDFFPFEFIKGSKAAFKNNKYGIALEENEAKKLFGDRNPINQIVATESGDVPVLGIYRLNPHSSLKPQVVLSTIDVNLKNDENSWGNYNYGLMVKLKDATDKKLFEKTAYDVLVENKLIPAAKEEGISIEQFIKDNGTFSVELQMLADARLSKEVTGFLEGKGNRLFLQINVGLSFLILVLSIINYINLSTAQAVRRAKEVGIRKVLGASKKIIIGQFVFETALTAIFALLFALCITELCLPFYNDLINKTLTIELREYWEYLLVIILFVILFAGLFPAIYIANFEELKVLKGNFSRSKSGIWLRNSMLVFQFAVAAFFIVSGIIVNRQVNHLAQKDLGFKGDQVLTIKYGRTDVGDRFAFYETFKQDLLKLPGVIDVNVSTANFGGGASSSSGFSLPNSKLSTQAQNIAFDFGFLKMMKIELMEGRDLSPAIASDSVENILLNQRAIQDLGGKVPLGTEFIWNGEKMKLVGIIKDFNLKAPQDQIQPMLLMHMKTVGWIQSNISNVLIKIKSENAEQTIAGIEKFWKQKVDSDAPFEYDFISNKFARSYEDYVKQQKMFAILNFVVIGIALFGLFALASYTIERKYKEIAIRKVLGAETGTLLALLSRQYICLAVAGFFIAIVPSYLFMQKWLDNFAYRIDISVMVYVLSFMLILILTLIVVLWKAYVATKIRLLNYLKYE